MKRFTVETRDGDAVPSGGGLAQSSSRIARFIASAGMAFRFRGDPGDENSLWGVAEGKARSRHRRPVGELRHPVRCVPGHSIGT